MRFKVLGPLEAVGEDGPVTLGGPKQRTVLAHLLVRVNELVPAETLIDRVWGDEPPEAARGTLHSYISHLRKALGAERIEGRAPGYVLHAADEELDAARFEHLLHEARLANGSPARAGAILREALALWTGPALADLATEASLAAPIARLSELRVQALEERIAADIAQGRHGEVIGELEALTRELPLRERLWELMMLALYRSRRPADALAAFERARDGLARELGVDPSPDLRRLHERILREDPDLDLEGEPLRGYRLLDQVGEGAFGVVYRAIQPQVGREVAIKAVHPELANHPDFVRRFDHEAQIVARLEHPHVVPLYDYWREPNAAYLVMRFLRGGSVEDLLEAGPLEPSHVTSIVDQIASALGAAHRQGVVHRDVKPGNVLLDEEGNAYLTDFGVALDSGSPERSSGTMMRGTPAYLSPEQIRLRPAGPQSDVYALGIVVFEMLTGEHPFPDTSLTALLDHHVRDVVPSTRSLRPQLPPAVDEVIGRATAKDANDRFSDIEEIARALRAAFEGTRVAPQPAGPVRNPYKGLRAFLEADALDFFGRETAVKRLLQSMVEDGHAQRFLAVVGPSGSGKSSVVRAGLVPALRRGAIPGSERWYVIDVLPGLHPFREIETALMSVAVEPPPSLMEELERDELGIVRAVDRVLPDPEAELVIVLDQLEEVFTMIEDGSERARFLASIEAAALQPNSRVRMIATLRADFYDAPLSVPGFGDLLAARTEAVTPMTPEELERAIVAPADQAGLIVEPRLLAEMIADVADRPGGLPLLQYALTELAERAEGRTLTLDAYRRIGRVSGALARRAEQLFEAMGEEAREASRQLFLRLVTLGEGVEDTRRRVRRSEFVTLADPQTMDAVIETFGRHRLLSFDRDPDTREPTVEIAHEALLREWARLRAWIDDVREHLRQRARISSATTEWVQAEQSSDYLLSGIRLAQAEEATWDDSIRLTDTEREFLDSSLAHRDAEVAAERMRQARELALERRARLRLRGFVAVLAAGLLVAASLTFVAANRTREAGRLRIESLVNTLTSTSVASLTTDPDLSLLLAVSAIDAVPTGDRVPAETVEALHWSLQEAGVEYPVAHGPVAVVASPLGARGIIDLPFPRLVEAARAHIRSLTTQECARFESLDASCEAAGGKTPDDLVAEPVRAIEPADPGQPLAGTTVSVAGIANDGPVFLDLQRWGEEHGIRFDSTDVDPTIGYALDTESPDIAFFGQPGSVPAFARDGLLIDLGTYLDVAQLREDYSPYLLSLGTVGPHSSWPSSDGVLYGALTTVDLKSLVWYPARAFERAGYEIPRSWSDLLSLSARMVDDGRTPWCMGLQSGGSDGWPATDWIENLLLGSAGPEVYNRWTFHQIPFDNPAVRRAFERFGDLVFGEGNLYRGTAGAVNTNFYIAHIPMVESDPPGCWLYYFPTFLGEFEPSIGTRTQAFRFPVADPRSGDTLLGAGSMVTALSDRPEVREAMRFLLSPAFGEELATSGSGALPANRRFDRSNYDPFWRQQAELLDEALAADAFRFDGSDLMPPPIGNGMFWDAMIRYLQEGPESLDAILAELDDAWPDDG